MDLSFKTTHDENGIPICCMTCAKWSFAKGKSCDCLDVIPPCSEWVKAKYYEGGTNGSNQSKTP